MDKISSLAHRVLIGIYNEQIKEKANTNKLSATYFGTNAEGLVNAILELEEKNYITGAKFAEGGKGNKKLAPWLGEVEITHSGAEYLAEHVM
ncbi:MULTISPECIES: YjcQ family protein [Bacillus cereus group]|uniref:YjcQ family protein n=1 Tax=Bacillus cereus group TaxID=86661 RepID=UPI001AEF053A|nr:MULTISPECIES: YjcQ family protein [Bacillus cereus group]QTR79160.1 hypothetical protein JC773_00800 [Bacillus cytotoxicus]